MGDRATAQQLYNQAVTSANDKSKPEYLQHAYQLFCSAMTADPTWAEASYQAGNNASDLNHLPAAIACWRRALECESSDADKAKILCNLGWRLQSLGQIEEALQATEQALALDPDLSFSHLNRSIILGTTDRASESAEAARRAYALKPDDPTVEMGLAFSLLFNRNLAEGFKHFESRYAYRLFQFQHYPYPRWEGQEGKTVFLVADQGLGDTLSFARFITAACKKCSFVHVCVQPELLKLFQYAFGHIPNINLLPMPANFPAADYWTTFVSLPFALKLTDEEIRNTPQIEPTRVHIPRNWKVADRKLHIGIAWRGSRLNEINEHRSIPITQFLELYRVPGVQLYSLQVDESKEQLRGSGCLPVIQDLSGYIRDVVDTVSIMKDLDLVITCESALGHICALARKEAWIPYSYLGRDYRIGHTGEDQLWSNHRIFRQGPDREWGPVFARMVEALHERVKTTGTKAA